MRKFFSSVLEVVEIALIAVGSVFLIRTFLVQPFVVSGTSMTPNFQNGDYLLVDELTYRFRVPERGEVVVFRYEHEPSTYFIKRIIGLPGEKVQIMNDEIHITTVSGRTLVLKEPYLPPTALTGGTAEYSLAANQYFVLGDNREFSFDSRRWGPLDAKDLVGLVRLRLWPMNDFTAFAAPQY